LSHRTLVNQKTKGMPELHDIRQACMKRLVTVWNGWVPELGRFGMFAAQGIDWEIEDYLKQRRAQVPVQRSVNVNEPAKDDDDDDHEGAVEMSHELYEAKRRLVAERLGCLNHRERRIVEGRLALNGSTRAATLDELADQFRISRGQVQQIERRAAITLQRAVA
jgi:RNA polymerase sigma factor (sigma-70 family)